jgi:signal transduction histidine kinase
VLSNASKFTPEDGRITVTADCMGDQVRVRIADTGIGIHAEDAPKVFEAFRQIDGSLSRRYNGTGLGLALTKRLVELQNGSIAFESEPGVGTTFTILLPAVKGGLRTEG